MFVTQRQGWRRVECLTHRGDDRGRAGERWSLAHIVTVILDSYVYTYKLQIPAAAAAKTTEVSVADLTN